MNAQQARIHALLETAAEQFEVTGRVDLLTTAELAAEGYDLAGLARDMTRIITGN